MTAFRRHSLDSLNSTEVAAKRAGLSRYGNGFGPPPGGPLRGLTFPKCIKRGATWALESERISAHNMAIQHLIKYVIRR